MKAITMSVEAIGNTPRTWGGNGVLKIQGKWFSINFQGRLTPFNGPVENVRQGPFPASRFGATAMDGVRWLNQKN